MAKKRKKTKTYNKIKYVTSNYQSYISLYFGVLGVNSLILSIVTCVFDFTQLLSKWEIGYKILLVIGIYLFLALLIFPFFLLKKRITYYKNGEFEVSAEYGDINKISSKRGNQKMIVIMVNTTFDMLVEKPGLKALVSENTSHGRFANRVCEEKKIEYDQLNQEIQGILEKNKDLKYEIVKRERGNTKNYLLGTSIVYELGRISYLLFAFSRFNRDNNTYPIMNDLPLGKLMEEINKHSQNCDVYIPLIGTGQSDYKLSNEESFYEMKHYFLSHKNKIEAKYRILVHNNIRDEVSIFKNS